MLKVTLVSIKNVLDVLSEYSQEVGRTGRDGSGSNACLYFNATDVANDHVEKSMKEFSKVSPMNLIMCLSKTLVSSDD
jgi:superfamily II DNA helicase RecQ